MGELERLLLTIPGHVLALSGLILSLAGIVTDRRSISAAGQFLGGMALVFVAVYLILVF